MSEPTPVPAKPQNTAAVISIASAVVGLFILPIILAPLAVIAGFVGTSAEGPNWSSATGIIAGFGEIIYLLVQWANAGVF